MRRLVLCVALASGCAAPETPPVTTLPDVGEPGEVSGDDRALSLEQALRVAADLIRTRETPGHLDRAVAVLRHQWNANRRSAPLNLMLAEAHARIVDTLDLHKSGDAERHKRHREAG